ncbi:MAG: hypothetical protein RLP44_17995 [Aggregatilineales bacterium]
MTILPTTYSLQHHPNRWKRLGIALERGESSSFDSSVTGDPCIVWDAEYACYRMFYFAQRHANGKEVNANAHAIAVADESIPNNWEKLGLVIYENPEALLGDAHKPWILMDPFRPNMPAKVDNKFWLFAAVWHGSTKRIQVATSQSLSGAWHVHPSPVIELGIQSEFDSYHNDTVTAYWFADRGEILLFYKGYPSQPQADQPHSPFGSSSAAAVMKPNEPKARKLGKIIAPHENPAHWLAGWVGGIQIFPAEKGGWYGLLNGSPTPPESIIDEPDMREPAPSLGGWAYTPEAFPISGWLPDEQPIEWIEDIPSEARKHGEGVNIWRHHGFITPDGNMYLLYNTGPYGQERLFLRQAEHDGFLK